MQLSNGIFIIPQYINCSTCFERCVAHHQEPQLYLQVLVYIRLWRPPLVPSEWQHPGTYMVRLRSTKSVRMTYSGAVPRNAAYLRSILRCTK